MPMKKMTAKTSMKKAMKKSSMKKSRASGGAESGLPQDLKKYVTKLNAEGKLIDYSKSYHKLDSEKKNAIRHKVQKFKRNL